MTSDLVGGGQGCCYMSCYTQGSPHPKDSSGRIEKPCPEVRQPGERSASLPPPPLGVFTWASVGYIYWIRKIHSRSKASSQPGVRIERAKLGFSSLQSSHPNRVPIPLSLLFRDPHGSGPNVHNAEGGNTWVQVMFSYFLNLSWCCYFHNLNCECFLF